MKPLATSLLLTLALIAPSGYGGDSVFESAQEVSPQRSSADFSTAPRVEVHKPAEIIPLYQRHKRIHGLQPFQELVDAAEAGSELLVPAGQYAGPVLLNKPLSIVGNGEVTIDGGDKGTVFILATDHARLSGLTLTGSGESHDGDDACVNVRGNYNHLEKIVIADCLFGIDLKQSNHNVIRDSRVTTKAFSLGLRGDGIRLWYSNHNLIENNHVADVRDMVAWYSHHNVFRGNEGHGSRYSIHFMFADHNAVIGNRFYDNAVGIYFMYSEDCEASNNIISHATSATGMALGFKESSNILISNNDIIYSGIGVGSDLSPFQPDTSIVFRNNRFAYNGIAIQLTSELGGNLLIDNIFEGNLHDVVQGGRGDGNKNTWFGNYFDSYQGFDRDGDGFGDQAHEDYAFADRIWMEIPPARFFKASPVLELLDFLERLAPFTTPELQARDEHPLYHRPERKLTTDYE